MPAVASNGITIHYTECGSGYPLILLMGLGASGEKWEEHVNAYREFFRCIMPDNRGAGLSSAPNEDAYTTAEMAEDIVGLMEQLNIDCAHIHGISMGGAIAQNLAIKYPEKVRSLILTSTFPYMEKSAKRAIGIFRDSIGKIPDATFSHLLNYVIFSPEYQNTCYEELLDREKKDANNPNPMTTAAFKAQCDACITHNTLGSIDKIKAPTLIAAGGVDLLVPMHVTMRLAEGIPDSELYVCETGGHVHHWEHLTEFNSRTLNFLRKY